MNISLNWLRDFVDWTGSVDELSNLLTRTGIAVESVTTKGADFPQVVIVQILESTQHPNADRLSVCRVDDGSGHPRQIVCGAKNYKVGDKVPAALPGAVLPGDFKIKVGKLRGVESEGMLCSAKELGLADDAEGLLILPADAPVGQPLSALYPADTIFELEITPNRADWLSHVGVAREVAAFSPAALKWNPPAIPTTKAEGVSVEAPQLCPFYSVRRITGVKVGPSPAWLAQRLEAIGLRAINNIVDITNYVMMEMGQPLHAFDAAKVSGDIRVRLAQAGEKFLALDGREYTLQADQLVIADGSSALALAGVMGGELSGVTKETTEILLESAIFQPSSIRRTGRALDLHSDSSYRFERGVDPAGALVASARAAQLIAEIAGGSAEDAVLVAGTIATEATPIILRTARCRAILGTDISKEKIRESLIGLGLTPTSETDDTSTWKVSSHRADLTREIDLIEEVARVVDIENIAGRVAAAPAEPSDADAAYDYQMETRQMLVGLGLNEARTSTLISAAMLWADVPPLRLKNPLGEDQAFLRTSLIPGLLAAVERNLRQGAKTIALYEIGTTFQAGPKEETKSLALALTGEAEEHAWRGGAARAFDWYDAKGLLNAVLPDEAEWVKVDAVAPLALRADILVKGERVGLLGLVSPAVARNIDAKSAVLVAELDLDKLRGLRATRKFQEIAKFPAVTRDLAIVAPATLNYGEIAAVLRDAKEELLTAVEPFDIFSDPTGEKLPADRKSVAISLTFRSAGRTLGNEEVTAACERLRQQLKSKLAVDFRE